MKDMFCGKWFVVQPYDLNDLFVWNILKQEEPPIMSNPGGFLRNVKFSLMKVDFKCSEWLLCVCAQALSRCSLKHCVALWQLLSSLKSETMLRLKRVRYSTRQTLDVLMCFDFDFFHLLFRTHLWESAKSTNILFKKNTRESSLVFSPSPTLMASC